MSYELDNLWERRQANFNEAAVRLTAFAKACQLAAEEAGQPVSKEWRKRIQDVEKAMQATGIEYPEVTP
jgi:hypothetical protein